MEVMEAANVEEAVALATNLKQEGKYNWFRGQLREWEPASSLERKLNDNPDTKKLLDAKLNRFIAWIEAQPALAYLADVKNEDALFAVLQHYGFPTCHIDFTTDAAVAGFFASDCPSPPDESGNSVIYCLNTEDLVNFYELLNTTGSLPRLCAEPVVVNVPNLWRLQSQRGCFIHANHSWYLNYDMDRIIFPWSGPPAFPSRDQIYPPHKSALEQLLEHYFFNEKKLESEEAIRNFVSEAKKKGRHIRSIHITDPLKHKPEAFSSPLKTGEQWSSESLEEWFRTPVEHYDCTVGRHIPVPLRSDKAAPAVAYQVQKAIESALNWDTHLRGQAIEWSFTGLPDNVDEKLLVAAARDAWNGMRNLPYTHNDIAAAISALVPLCSLPDVRSFNVREAALAFKSWIPDAMQVEFGNRNGSGSRAYCSDTTLLGALDKSWMASLRTLEPLSSVTSAFCVTYDPRLMFDFKRLTQIFAREVIPSQLAMKRPIVLFNPAELDSFGLP